MVTWVTLRSGARFDLLAPDASTLMLADLLEPQPYIVRFNGAAGNYTNADHLLGSMLYLRRLGRPPRVQAAGLTHDVHEACLGDLASPLKEALGREVIARLEFPIERCVADFLTGPTWSMPVPMAPEVKQADLALVLAERDTLMTPRVPWGFEDSVVVPHTGRLYRGTTARDLAEAMQLLADEGVEWSPTVQRELTAMLSKGRFRAAVRRTWRALTGTGWSTPIPPMRFRTVGSTAATMPGPMPSPWTETAGAR